MHAPTTDTDRELDELVFERAPSRERILFHRCLATACSLQAAVGVALVVAERFGSPFTLHSLIEWLEAWALALSISGPTAAYGSLLALIVLPLVFNVVLLTRSRRRFGRAELGSAGIEFRVSLYSPHAGREFIRWSQIAGWRVTETAILVKTKLWRPGGYFKPLTIPTTDRDQQERVTARLETELQRSKKS